MKFNKEKYLEICEKELGVGDRYKQAINNIIDNDDVEIHRLFYMSDGCFEESKPYWRDCFYYKSIDKFYEIGYFSYHIKQTFCNTKFFSTAQEALRNHLEIVDKQMQKLQQHKEDILNKLIIK